MIAILWNVAQLFFLLCWYLIASCVLYPLYAIPIMIKLVKRSREKRRGKPKPSRGIRIMFFCFRMIGWILILSLLPFYGVYLIATMETPERKKKAKKDNLSWIDRFEEYDALFH